MTSFDRGFITAGLAAGLDIQLIKSALLTVSERPLPEIKSPNINMNRKKIEAPAEVKYPGVSRDKRPVTAPREIKDQHITNPTINPPPPVKNPPPVKSPNIIKKQVNIKAPVLPPRKPVVISQLFKIPGM